MTKEKVLDKKKNIFLAVLGIILVLLGLGTFQYFKMKKAMQDRRAAMEIQKQVMIDSWKEEGLTDEEIQERLGGTRSQRFPADGRSPNPMFMLRRIIGGDGRGGGIHPR